MKVNVARFGWPKRVRREMSWGSVRNVASVGSKANQVLGPTGGKNPVVLGSLVLPKDNLD